MRLDSSSHCCSVSSLLATLANCSKVSAGVAVDAGHRLGQLFGGQTAAVAVGDGAAGRHEVHARLRTGFAAGCGRIRRGRAIRPARYPGQARRLGHERRTGDSPVAARKAAQAPRTCRVHTADVALDLRSLDYDWRGHAGNERQPFAQFVRGALPGWCRRRASSRSACREAARSARASAPPRPATPRFGTVRPAICSS